MSSLPLTRNQIFDVATLIGRAQRDAAILAAAAAAGGRAANGGSLVHKPIAAVSGYNATAAAVAPTISTPSLFATSTAADGAPLVKGSSSKGFGANSNITPQQQAAAPPATVVVDYTIRSGLFLDVVAHPACASWTATEKALYLVWWAHRPTHCRVCGSNDRWLPSTDDEYQCDHCSSGNGSTRTNEVVEDMPGLIENDGDSSQDDNDGPLAGGREGRSGVQALVGAALVSLFCVYMTHLDRLPIDVRPPSSIYPNLMRMATELAELVPLPSAGEAQLSGKGGYEALSSGSSADEEEHPGTLVRTASLFIACCVVCPGLVPFPLFMRSAPARQTLLAAAATQSHVNGLAVGASSIFNNNQQQHNQQLTADALSANSNALLLDGGGNAAVSSTAADTTNSNSNRAGAFACQWMDVAALASNIGFVLDDFFDSEGTISAFLTNVMVMIKDYAPSTLSYSPQRDPSRMTFITGVLMGRRNGTRNSKRPAAGTALSAIRPKQRFSPEHTAVFVALELVRCFQSSKEGANCQRMHEWYARNAPLFLPNYAGGGAGASKKNGNGGAATAASSTAGGGYANEAAASYGELLPSTSWGNLLLWIFAKELFGISPLELCELLMASGLYGGPTRFFEALTDRVSGGFYDVPLQRRLRPYVSPWAALFSALHSEDRLVLMSALHLATQRFGENGSAVGGGGSGSAPNGTLHNNGGGGANPTTSSSKEEQRVVELVQRILRKHGSLHRYQFNYGLRVTDGVDKHFNGNFFANHVSDYCAVYTCLKSGRKTIAFDANNDTITLNFMGIKTRQVSNIECEFVGPVVATIEDLTTKMVLDLVRHQLHELEWADAQRRIVAREMIKRRLQSGTNPRIALSELRQILSSAVSSMAALTAHCGMVATGELNANGFNSSNGSLASSISGGGAFGGGESLIGNSFTNISPFTPVGSPVFTPRGAANKAFPSSAAAPAAKNSLSRLDDLSYQSAQRFAAAMSGGGVSGGGAATAGGGDSDSNAAAATAQQQEQYILARYLQNRQRATLLRSLERQTLQLPHPALVMGLPVTRQLELFAEHHALSEGTYIPNEMPSTVVAANANASSSRGDRSGKGGKRGGGGNAGLGSDDDNASSLLSAATAVGSEAIAAPTVSIPYLAEEEALNKAIDAVTGAGVMLSSASGGGVGMSPTPGGGGPIAASVHVSSSTFRLESRYAAELQLKSAISRYQTFRRTGEAGGAEEEAAVAQRAERRRRRLQQQMLQMQEAEKLQSATALNPADIASPRQQGGGGADLASPPSHFTAIQRDRRHIRDSGGLDGGGGDDATMLLSPPSAVASSQQQQSQQREKKKDKKKRDREEAGDDGDEVGGGLPEGGLFDVTPFSPDGTAATANSGDVSSSSVSHKLMLSSSSTVPPALMAKAPTTEATLTVATTTAAKTKAKAKGVSPVSAAASVSAADDDDDDDAEILSDDSSDDDGNDTATPANGGDETDCGGRQQQQQRRKKKDAPPQEYLLRKETQRAAKRAREEGRELPSAAAVGGGSRFAKSQTPEQSQPQSQQVVDDGGEGAVAARQPSAPKEVATTPKLSHQQEQQQQLASAAAAEQQRAKEEKRREKEERRREREEKKNNSNNANNANNNTTNNKFAVPPPPPLTASAAAACDDDAVNLLPEGAPFDVATMTAVNSPMGGGGGAGGKKNKAAQQEQQQQRGASSAEVLTTLPSSSSSRRNEMAKRRMEKLKNERFADESHLY